MQYFHQLEEVYNVTTERGFLPKEDPLQRLPSYFDPWEDLVVQLPDLLRLSLLRNEIAKVYF